MTTAAQTTLLHAAELLEDAARKLQISHPEAIQLDIRAAFHYELQDKLTTALELRLLARSMQAGHTAVPYVASEVEQQVLRKALFKSAKIPAPTFEGETK